MVGGGGSAEGGNESPVVHGKRGKGWVSRLRCERYGGFQNTREEGVLVELRKSEEGGKWIPWTRQFFRVREFQMEWDG